MITRVLSLSIRWSIFLAVIFVAQTACSATDSFDTRQVASVELSSSSIAIERGKSVSLSARVRDERGSLIHGRSIVWSSSNTAVASVSSFGVVTARLRGEAQIAASASGKSAVVSIVVSEREAANINVAPAALSIRIDQGTQLQARVSDASGDLLDGRAISWSSSNPLVASVNDQGMVRGRSAGATTISAVHGSLVAQAAVTVTPEPVSVIVVTPPANTIVAGSNVSLSAVTRSESGELLEGRAVSWSSINPSIATVSSAGVVTAISRGSTNIVAVSEGKAGQASITVVERLADAITITPSSLNLEVGQSESVLAHVTDPNGNIIPDRAILFRSENSSVASVSPQGVITAISPGTARIVAESDGKSAFASVVVASIPVASVRINPQSVTVREGSTFALTATALSSRGQIIDGQQVSWFSGSPSIVSVNQNGLVTAVSEGVAMIGASISGVTSFSEVVVQRRRVASVILSHDTLELFPNTGVYLLAQARDASGNEISGRQFSWHSSDDSVVFVSSTGQVLALRIGTAIITVTSEGVSARTVILVR